MRGIGHVITLRVRSVIGGSDDEAFEMNGGQISSMSVRPALIGIAF